MRARIGGGIAGWLIGVVPLIVMNVLDYEGLFDQQDAVLAGLIALVGGVLLGGIACGLLGKRGGGAASAAISGAVAAFFYAATLIGLVLGASRLDFEPSLIARHPLRVSMAIIFVAAILLAIASVTGALASRGERDARANPASSRPASRPRHPQSHPNGQYRSPMSHPDQRPLQTRMGPRAGGASEPYESRRSYDSADEYDDGYRGGRPSARSLPPDASDPRYAASSPRPAGSSGSRRDPHYPPRNDGWPPSGR